MNRAFVRVGALLLIGLLVRALYLVQYSGSPFWCLLYGDPEIYHERALAIAAGRIFGSGVDFHSSPLYPYFLALVYRVAGVHIPAVFAAQALLGVVSAALLALVAERLMGRTGFWLTGILAACWPISVYLDAELLEMTLVLLGVHLMLFRLVRHAGHPRTPLLAGLGLGLAILGKPNSLLFLPVWITWQWRRGIRGVLLFAAGALAVVLPFTLRNLVVGHDLVLTSSNGGINLYIGNNPSARGTFAVPARMEADLFASSKKLAEMDVGHALGPSAVSSYWAGKALSWLLSHPGDAAALYARKVLLFWNHTEIPNHFDANFLERWVPLLRFTPFRFGFLAPFAIWGLVVAARRVRRPSAEADRIWAVPLLWVGTYFVSLLPFFVTERYRLPAVTVLLLFASLGVLDLVERWRTKPRSILGGAVVVGLGFVLAWLPIARASDYFPFQWQILGSAARDRGDFEKAAEAYGEALALEPRSVLAQNSLGVCLARLGRAAESAAHFEEAVRLDPTYPPAWRNLGRARAATAGPEAGIECLERALALDPQFTDARRDLVEALVGLGRADAALEQLDLILAREPGDLSTLWNRAVLLSRMPNRGAEALRTLDRFEAAGGRTDQSAALRRALSAR